MEKSSEAGAKHLVTSTFKPRYDGWRRFEKAFPEVAKNLKPLYFKQGEKISNAWYLPRKIKEKHMFRVKEECSKYGLPFATCREGLGINTSKSCDGSHLINY